MPTPEANLTASNAVDGQPQKKKGEGGVFPIGDRAQPGLLRRGLGSSPDRGPSTPCTAHPRQRCVEGNGQGVANGGRQARTMALNSHAQSPTPCTAPTLQRCAGGHGLARGLQGIKWHHTVSSFWHGATLVDRMPPGRSRGHRDMARQTASRKGQLRGPSPARNHHGKASDKITCVDSYG